MPGNDRVLIENLKKQQLLYTVAEKGAESTELKIIGSMKEALHPGNRRLRREGILNAMARPQTAIVSLTVTEKGYCADAASGQLDLDNRLISTIWKTRLRRSPRLVTSSKPCVCVVKKG